MAEVPVPVQGHFVEGCLLFAVSLVGYVVMVMAIQVTYRQALIHCSMVDILVQIGIVIWPLRDSSSAADSIVVN